METRKNFYMHVPTRIFFGVGQIEVLHKEGILGKKALIVTSNGKSTKANGYLAKVEEELKKANVSHCLFDKIEANPTKNTAMQGGMFAKDNGCDFIIALGGGSVMDCSKAIATMATNSGDLWDYIFGGTGKQQPIKNTPLPIVAITTTAGTGSEVDQYGVITNEDTNEKIGFGGIDDLFPKVSIIDANLMLSVPKNFTAFQGFDALFHSVECFISKGANLMSDMYAPTSIENIGKYLSRAVNNGKDVEAREHVAFSNTISGVVMTLCSTTSEHSMEHAMSAYHSNLPHGAGLIMISKAYFTFFIKKGCCPERYIKMAQLLGMKEAKEPMDFITALCNLQKECGVDDLKMSDYGIKEDELRKIAVNAKETMGGLFLADRYQLTENDCVEIYKESYK